MSRPTQTAGSCGDTPPTPLAAMPYDRVERNILTVARHYFRSFAAPSSQSWVSAIGAGLALFGSSAGPQVAVATLGAVQAMRQTRESLFHFSSPCCASCAAGITRHECAFLSALRAVRRGEDAKAGGHAMILCEGNDHARFLAALDALSRLLPAPDDRDRAGD